MSKYFATLVVFVCMLLGALEVIQRRGALQAQSTFTDNCTVITDTRLEQKAPTTNYASATTLWGAGNVNDVGQLAEAAMKFECSAIPQGAQILSAKLKINVTHPTTDTYHVFELLRPWTETGATWNNYASGATWTVAGARDQTDRASTVLAAFTNAGTGVREIPLTTAGVALVSGWVNGTAVNNGVLLRPRLTGDDVGFHSRENTVPAVLEVIAADGTPYPLPVAADTRLEEKQPTTNYASATTLWGAGDVNLAGQMAAAAIKFNVLSIPPGTPLQRATLKINVNFPTTDAYDLFELKKDWTESGATWMNFAAGAPWDVAGAKGLGDRGATVLASFPSASTGQNATDLNTAGLSLVSGWVNGTTPNYGILLRPPLTADDVGFNSRENTTPPVIEVTYQVSGGSQQVTVMTYNTKHGRDTSGQMDVIAAQNPRPDIVVLQEASAAHMQTFISGLNSRYGLVPPATFTGHHTPACNVASGDTCTSWSAQGTIVLSRLPKCDSESFWLKRADQYHAWRPVARMKVSLPNGIAVQAYSIHLPVVASARLGAIADLKNWTRAHSSPRLIGGDFNATPDATEINDLIEGMAAEYKDAWPGVGSGNGYTHDNDATLDRRIDYWFADKTGPATAIAASVPSAPGVSDHLPVVVTYTISSGSTCGSALRVAPQPFWMASGASGRTPPPVPLSGQSLSLK